MTHFDFDEPIDRREVPALKTHPNVLGDGGEDLFAAGVADMNFRVAPVIRDALTARLSHGVFGYEAVPGDLLPSLVHWLATRHGWEVDTDHILRAPNALNSLAISASLFSQRGDGVIVQPPVFFDFFDIIRENDRTLIQNPLILRDGRYEIDFIGLEALAAAPENKILFLCNPHNPVGRVWTREELNEVGDICARHRVLVVSDELHGDLTYPGQTYTPFASLGPDYAENSITILSPAKTFNIASCCSAFTVVPAARRREVFNSENSRLTVNKNNAFANAAMQAAYRHGAAWLDAVLYYLHMNLKLVRDRLSDMPGVDLIEPEGTFLLWLDFRDLRLSQEDLHAFLRQDAGWAVTRGVAFGTEGAGFARLNIACTVAELRAALDRLERALRERAR